MRRYLQPLKALWLTCDRYCGWVAEARWPDAVRNQVVTHLRKGQRVNEIRRGYLDNGNYGRGQWAVDEKGCPLTFNHRPFCKAFPLVQDNDQAHQAYHRWVWKQYDCETELPLESKTQPLPLREQLNWDLFVKEYIIDTDATTSPLFGYPFAYNPTSNTSIQVN